MTKQKYKQNNDHFYLIKIELKQFKNLNFNVDLSGSKNIEIIGEQGLSKEVVVPFFQEIEVAKLLLLKSWNLKTKFKFTLSYPDYKDQVEQLKGP